MHILCHIHSHQPDGSEIWNQGYCFSRCERCGSDLVRTGGAWQPVPRGHRVVWKSGPHRHSLESSFRGALPVPYASPGLARAAILLERLRPKRRPRLR